MMGGIRGSDNTYAVLVYPSIPISRVSRVKLVAVINQLKSKRPAYMTEIK